MLTNYIFINTNSIINALGRVTLLLVFASLAFNIIFILTGHGNIYGLRPLFDLDTERNIPTFFSSFMLLIAAILLLIIASFKKNKKASYLSHWRVLSFIFFYIALDELCQIHELLINPMRRLLGGSDLGIFYHAWVMPAFFILFFLALFFLKFILHLPKKTRFAFLMAATLYIGGALGIELIEGYIDELLGENFLSLMLTQVEESLEMLGIIIFIRALLLYIADSVKEVRFCFEPVHGSQH